MVNMQLQVIPDVHRATHRIGIEIGRCPGVSVSQGEAHILAHLHAEGESSIAQLHAALAHKRSTLTSILDRLADRKFVTRAVDPDDRRSFRIALTPSGTKAAARIYRHLEALEHQALQGITPAQRKAFTAVILKLANAGRAALAF
jgi:DNA-binding MarR family transcriptional regulator